MFLFSLESKSKLQPQIKSSVNVSACTHDAIYKHMNTQLDIGKILLIFTIFVRHLLVVLASVLTVPSQ